MNIKYYQVEDYRYYNHGLPSCVEDGKFLHQETLANLIYQHIQFDSFPSVALKRLQTYKQKIVRNPIFKEKKNKNKTIEIVRDKKGDPIISHYFEDVITVVDKDFCNYIPYRNNVSALDLNGRDGVYKTVLGDPVKSIKKNKDGGLSVTIKAQVFVRFFNTKVHYEAEVKQEGLPYRPVKESIEYIELPEKYPVYINPGDRYNSATFSLSDDSRPFYERYELYFLDKTVHIKSETLTIDDSKEDLIVNLTE